MRTWHSASKGRKRGAPPYRAIGRGIPGPRQGINRAELYALVETLRRTDGRDIGFFTDSSYVEKGALRSAWKRWKPRSHLDL